MSSDRPREGLALIAEIRSLSFSQRASSDFLTSSFENVTANAAINWKTSDSTITETAAMVRRYGDPLVTFLFNRTYPQPEFDADDFVRDNADALKSRSSVSLYNQYRAGYISPEVDELLQSRMTNDYEFIQCYVRQMETDLLKGRYPEDALMEYLLLEGKDTLCYRAFADKYHACAVSALAQGHILSQEFYGMRSDGDYVALRQKCILLKKKCRSFTSRTEKTIASAESSAGFIMDNLDRRSNVFKVTDGILEMYLQNTDKVRVVISKGKKKVASLTVCDSLHRYYVADTVRVPLPDTDDGEYEISAGKGDEKVTLEYVRNSISAAIRADAGGLSLYVAESVSGKPLEFADITFYKDDEAVKSLPGFGLNGFTRLPSEACSAVDELMCSCRDKTGRYRCSGRISVQSRTPAVIRRSISKNPKGVLLLNSSVFNPGDSVHFKAILYRQKDVRSNETLAEDEKVVAFFLDPDGKQMASLDLKTNDFGSVAGTFSTAGLGKLGRCRISVRIGRREVTGESFTVSDVILPSFDLTFDALESIPLKEDTIVQTGKLTGYSGHLLSGCSASYSIDGGDFRALDIRPDGSFSIDIVPSRDLYYRHIRVKIVDLTGHTREFSNDIYLNDELRLSLSLADLGNSICRDISGSDIPVACNDTVKVDFRLCSGGKNLLNSSRLGWRLLKDGRDVLCGTALDGEPLSLDMSGLPQDIYVLKAEASLGNHSCVGEMKFVIVRDNDYSLLPGISSFARIHDGSEVGLQIGSSTSPLWACISVFGPDNRLILSRMVEVTEDTNLRDIGFGSVEEFPDNVLLDVFWFKDGRSWKLRKIYSRQVGDYSLPLSFSRMCDRSLPSSKCYVALNTSVRSECAVTVFDKSTELFDTNYWTHKLVASPYTVQKPYVWYDTVCGRNSTDMAVMFRRMAVMNKSVAAADVLSCSVEEETIPYQMAENSSASDDILVRENFASAIAFEPFLHSDADGNVGMEFETSDRLSTFIVQAYVHDKSMQTAAARREFTVTVPAEVDLVPPKYLYRGDEYVVNGSISSSSEESVSGTVTLTFSRGRDKVIGRRSSRVEIPAGGQVPFSFNAPQTDADTLGIKAIFVADDNSFSDGVFVTVPVCEPVRTFVEAHSAVLLPGMSEDRVLGELRGRFVNTSSYGAEYSEISILDMVREAIPDKVVPASDNVIALTEALYSGRLGAELSGSGCEDASVVSRIGFCRNPDGGFAWFRRMQSSPIITAVVLYRLAGLRDRGLLPDKELTDLLPGAVRYLDKAFFGKEMPLWRGGVPMEKYMLVRSMYAEVPFEADVPSGFGKIAREYLTPSGDRGLNGAVDAKAVRVLTLRNLTSSEDGMALAESWGARSLLKANASLESDIASLKEYAVSHKDGGMYYPNAVMPYRGLMEGELFAHAILCNIFKGVDDKISDGIRIWMMIQKETQHWDDEPAFVDAVSSILEGTPEALSTKVVLMKKKYISKFSAVKEAGNGFTIDVKWLRENTTTGKYEELAEGTALNVGDKVIARYELWSGENRSFVRVKAPRPASLRPVQELSGWNGWCYRNVLPSETEYWFDAFPEERSTHSEDFFVTQEGVFTCPVLEIESIYAPHYRANSSYKGTFKSIR